MNPIFSKIFKLKTKAADGILNTIKDVSTFTHIISTKKKELSSQEYALLLEQKEEVFLSLSDFLELVDAPDLKIEDILCRCKHASEISTKNTSVVNVYTIVEDDHIVLCKDVKSCKKHSSYQGDSIKIITVKRNSK